MIDYSFYMCVFYIDKSEAGIEAWPVIERKGVGAPNTHIMAWTNSN